MPIIPRTDYVQCKACGSWTEPKWPMHYCFEKVGAPKMKKWDPDLQAWKVSPEPGEEDSAVGIRYYDTKTGTWVVDPSHEVKPSEKSYEVASCEIPAQKVKKDEPVKTLGPGSTGSGYYNNSYKYEPAKPWEGIDRHRWPQTWNKLVMMYYSKDWWGKWIDNDVYRDRILKGTYKAETKYPVYYGDNYYGDADDWRAYDTHKPAETKAGSIIETKKDQDPGDEGNPYRPHIGREGGWE